MPTPTTIECMTCKFFTGVKKSKEGAETFFTFFCKAFPKGIPEDIRSWRVPHIKVRKDQKGDYVYKEEEKS